MTRVVAREALLLASRLRCRFGPRSPPTEQQSGKPANRGYPRSSNSATDQQLARRTGPFLGLRSGRRFVVLVRRFGDRIRRLAVGRDGRFVAHGRNNRRRSAKFNRAIPAPARTPLRTLPRSGGRYSGSSASNDSYRSTSG